MNEPWSFRVDVTLVCVHCGNELNQRGSRGGEKYELNGFVSAQRFVMVDPEHECGYLAFSEKEAESNDD